MSKTAEGDPVYCEKDNLFPVLVNDTAILLLLCSRDINSYERYR